MVLWKSSLSLCTGTIYVVQSFRINKDIGTKTSDIYIRLRLIGLSCARLIFFWRCDWLLPMNRSSQTSSRTEWRFTRRRWRCWRHRSRNWWTSCISRYDNTGHMSRYWYAHGLQCAVAADLMYVSWASVYCYCCWFDVRTLSVSALLLLLVRC